MKLRSVQITVFCILLLNLSLLARAQNFDLSSGGSPTITGAVGGSVSGSSNTAQDLIVTINFGELSPANPNSIVKVIVPIFIRSTSSYQVTAVLSSTTSANPQSIQPDDAGFGTGNLRRSGGQICSSANHTFFAPFDNDPQTTAAIGSNGRIGYQSSTANLLTAPVVLSGPRLTQGNGRLKRTDGGYIFDAVFAVTPQFFAPGSTTAAITFSISSAADIGC
ncbi:MAG TPA: hypothetical protein VK308_08470 [Pyrinomonadaceae bacterium]|nr:hypothetical protein [Pyrinomonadaceae bacterium]